VSEHSGRPLRVVVADDHEATRVGIRQVLEDAGMEVCGEAATGDAAVAKVLTCRPDVALIDVLMGPTDGIEAARRIRDEAPGTVVIMITGSENPAHLLEALRAGARGYLLKTTDPDRLASAIRGVVDGEGAIPRTLLPQLFDEVARQDPERHRAGELTAREQQVMTALARGLTTAEAARALAVSEVTVRRHLSSAAEKLGASTRDDALARYRAADDPQN
jgi:DNA-binding NarL/FixJ family response regulator